VREALAESGQHELPRYAQLAIEELERATRKFPPMTSAHEGYAILLEEVDELWHAVKHEPVEQVQKEAVQVAAMALRFVRDVCETEAGDDVWGWRRAGSLPVFAAGNAALLGARKRAWAAQGETAAMSEIPECVRRCGTCSNMQSSGFCQRANAGEGADVNPNWGTECDEWLGVSPWDDIELGLRLLKVCREWVSTSKQRRWRSFIYRQIELLAERVCDVVGYHEGG
jgi:hypothetical protein